MTHPPGDSAGPSLPELIRSAAERPLSAEEAERAFAELIEGRASPVQMSALLVALRVRGATAAELAGGVRALRRAMVPLHAESPETLVDTCGTGGGTLSTFNISTAAALIAAGAGVRIAKHGNRSFTSRSGSADVLESLGVRLELSPEREARVLQEVGIVFMFAPLHHPAMRHVAPVRRELAMPTLMNLLGPLTNPARAGRQVVGVADPRLLELVAEALRELGHERALVVHGEPGMDEISPLGPTHGWELHGGSIGAWRANPTDFFQDAGRHAEFLTGGTPAENARTILRLLDNDLGGAARAAALLNAGAAVYVGGAAADFRGGVAAAERSLESGAALDRLRRLRDAAAING